MGLIPGFIIYYSSLHSDYRGELKLSNTENGFHKKIRTCLIFLLIFSFTADPVESTHLTLTNKIIFLKKIK